jgi:hypothetical protein
MGKIKKILLLVFCFVLKHYDIYAEDPNQILNYKLEKEKFPEITLYLDLKETSQIPVSINKEEISIVETIVDTNYQKNVVPFDIQILDSYTIEGNKIPTNEKIYTILLDSTLSLSDKDFESLKNYIKNFIKEKNKNDLISLYKINGTANRVANFTKSEKNLLTKLDGIKRQGKQTKIYDALYKALHDLYKFSKNKKEEIGGIILFTDAKEETSKLDAKDIDDLIKFGTKFEIPIYFVVVGNKKIQNAFEKISLKTGGDIFYNEFNPKLIKEKEQTIHQDEVFIKRLKISYKSSLSEAYYRYKSKINTTILYKNQPLLNFQYEFMNIYLWLLLSILFIILIIFIIYFYIKYQKNQKLKSTAGEKKDKLDFPEPNIGEVFADLRQYKDVPEKKYLETEEKPDIPLIAQNWVEPSYAPYLDDPLVRKQFSKETMTLSLKEKSYIVLQMALKEAPKYSHAMLIKKDREGLGADKQYDIFLEEVYIGSSSAAHIPIRDSAVSHIHAKIKRIDNKYILFDLMSLAGTYLNGKKVLRPMPLRHNDEIRMGHTIFRFVGED